MRQIKFRAWDKEFEGGTMTYSDERLHLEDFFCYHEGQDLMQFTGLLDKNGKQIYEGDLLAGKTPYSAKEPKLVVWDDKRAGFYAKCKFVAYDPKNLYKLSGTRWEVIGNVYENPELLNP